jgi:hypothetical protein
VGHLANLQAQFEDDLYIIEVFECAADSSELQLCKEGSWADANYLMVRTDPANQLSEDYAATTPFTGYPTLPLINLRTMRVVVEDCWHYPTTDAMDYEACIADHLGGD